MKLRGVVEPEPERPFAQMLWSLRRLGWPLLPNDVRLLRMQEAIDRQAARKALRVFGLEGVTVTALGSVPPGAGSGEPMLICPTASRDGDQPAWFNCGWLEWDGQLLTVPGVNHTIHRFHPSSIGVQPGYRADEVARAGVRPEPQTDYCPSAVVEMAGVSLEGKRMRRLYFLDEASRELAMISAVYLSEDDVAELARRAGISFRIYWISNGPRVASTMTRLAPDLRFIQGQLSPEEVCAAVFPHSARVDRREDVERVSRWNRPAYR